MGVYTIIIIVKDRTPVKYKCNLYNLMMTLAMGELCAPPTDTDRTVSSPIKCWTSRHNVFCTVQKQKHNGRRRFRSDSLIILKSSVNLLL